MDLALFNSLDKTLAETTLAQCCPAARWISGMEQGRPYATEKDLVKAATQIWYEQCNSADWKEAFSHHPRIGDIKNLTDKFAGEEQGAVGSAGAAAIEALARANQEYENTFGFIFIVCATGKTAAEMLRLLTVRLHHTREEEESIAMGEQMKITLLRLKKNMADANWQSLSNSQLTTHVLDTSLGRPGKDICIQLQAPAGKDWQTIALGITNADGRVPDLLPAERILPAGNYRLVFDTGTYYQDMQTTTFYPEAAIVFSIFDDTHYHVPLLLNPFGYATYRGS